MKDYPIAFFTTVSKMSTRQLLFTLNRKIRSAAYQNLPVSLDEYYRGNVNRADIDFSPITQSTTSIRQSLTEQDQTDLRQRLTGLQRGEVKFLNRTVELEDEPPSLVDPFVGEKRGFPRLWTLKLLSLEPASWIALASRDSEMVVVRTLLRWLESWLNHDVTSIRSQNCLRRYWTPYAVSRRISNLAMLGGVLSSRRATNCEMLCEHLAKNVRFLSNHIEYDIDGNHLLENACALIIGGVILDDETVVSRGVTILRSELPNQLLDDGMHFERSPMYHTILLYRITWSLDVLRRSGRTLPSDLVTHVKSMYGFLRKSAPGLANYPLLNDAVYREAVSRQSCLSIVENLLEITDAPDYHDSTRQSGYFSFESGGLMGIIDGGRHCPDHLPAHAHNDLGNIVVWAGEVPVITDTGTYDYQPGERRQYARSVEAHNTVQVDDFDQSVTHGRFMMGPRPKPTTKPLDVDSNQGITLHYHSPRFVGPYSHERFVVPIVDGIRIEDRVSAPESTVTSRLHLSPETDPHLEGDTIEILLPNESTVDISVVGADSIDIIETEQYPEYGVVNSQPTIEASLATEDEAAQITQEISYRRGTNDE